MSLCSASKTRNGIRAKWGVSENNRKARFYSLTAKGREQLLEKTSEWQRLTRAMGLILDAGTWPAERGGINMFKRKRSAEDFAEEIKAHLELEADELRDEGLSEDEARSKRPTSSSAMSRAAQETLSPAWPLDRARQIVTRSPLRHCARSCRAPALQLTAILTLALGVGANTAVFSVMNAVLLQVAAGRRSRSPRAICRTSNPPRGTGTIDSNETFPTPSMTRCASKPSGCSRH